jgi:L-2-hydroxyglutarate oxidase LhgO
VIAIVGGGVVGLAVARALARRGRDVVVLERHGRLGAETSTHNSGVIHAGLYYPLGSLKQQLCIEGRDRLYDYCERQGIPHVRCGKLVVSVSEADDSALAAVQANATAAGATVREVDLTFVKAREPHIACRRALWSPDTGWIDADAYVRALARDVQDADGVILSGTRLAACRRGPNGFLLDTERERIAADAIVNAAGLYADDVSSCCAGEPFTIYPCRGEYAELAPRARRLVGGLVYPVPHASGHGLGVHLTRTMDGAVWVGPTIRYQRRKDDYEGDRLPLEAFLEPTRRLLPGIQLADLRLSGSGIRAKLHPPEDRFADFMLREDRRQPGLFHAAGIDSPGLTASLAIGERLAALIG